MTDSLPSAQPEPQRQLQAPPLAPGVPAGSTPDAPANPWLPPGAAPEAPPGSGTGPAAAWHWCPNCHIASNKSLICPSCQQQFIPAPTEGLPYGPYTPHRSRRGPGLRFLAPFLMATLMILPLAGTFLLYRAGTPVSSSSTSNNTGLIDSGTRTAVSIKYLGKVQLPGAWAPDGLLADNVKAYFTTHGELLTAQRSGDTTLWAALQTSDVPQQSGGSSQCQVTKTGNNSLRLAGNTADTTDSTKVCQGSTTYTREYDMPLGKNGVFVMVVEANTKQPFDLIQQALLQLPNSSISSATL